jgi:hypothetical protein
MKVKRKSKLKELEERVEMLEARVIALTYTKADNWPVPVPRPFTPIPDFTITCGDKT